MEWNATECVVALFLGGALIIGSTKFLFYAMDRGGKLFYLAFLGGFPFFCLGFLLILFCFLSDPPSIFGFSIGLRHVAPRH